MCYVFRGSGANLLVGGVYQLFPRDIIGSVLSWLVKKHRQLFYTTGKSIRFCSSLLKKKKNIIQSKNTAERQ